MPCILNISRFESKTGLLIYPTDDVMVYWPAVSGTATRLSMLCCPSWKKVYLKHAAATTPVVAQGELFIVLFINFCTHPSTGYLALYKNCMHLCTALSHKTLNIVH